MSQSLISWAVIHRRIVQYCLLSTFAAGVKKDRDRRCVRFPVFYTERARFELAVGLTLRRFSRPVHSATLPPLQMLCRQFPAAMRESKPQKRMCQQKMRGRIQHSRVPLPKFPATSMLPVFGRLFAKLLGYVLKSVLFATLVAK